MLKRAKVELEKLMTWLKSWVTAKTVAMAAALGVFLIWLAILSGVIPLPGAIAERGTRADATAALFSALAFVAVVYSLHQQQHELELNRRELKLQRKDLALQRKELEMTRNELARSADAQVQSEKAMTRQAEMLLMAAKLSAVNSIVQSRTLLQSAETVVSENVDEVESSLQLAEIYLHELLQTASKQYAPCDHDRSFVGRGYLELTKARTLSKLRKSIGNTGQVNIPAVNTALEFLVRSLQLFLTQTETGDYLCQERSRAVISRAHELKEKIRTTTHERHHGKEFAEQAKCIIELEYF